MHITLVVRAGYPVPAHGYRSARGRPHRSAQGPRTSRIGITLNGPSALSLLIGRRLTDSLRPHRHVGEQPAGSALAQQGVELVGIGRPPVGAQPAGDRRVRHARGRRRAAATCGNRSAGPPPGRVRPTSLAASLPTLTPTARRRSVRPTASTRSATGVFGPSSTTSQPRDRRTLVTRVIGSPCSSPADPPMITVPRVRPRRAHNGARRAAEPDGDGRGDVLAADAEGACGPAIPDLAQARGQEVEVDPVRTHLRRPALIRRRARHRPRRRPAAALAGGCDLSGGR